MAAQSTHLRKRQSYITRSNVHYIKKRASGVKVALLKKKRGKAPSCGDCKKALPGIPAKRPAAFARLKKSQRTVSRAYGGVLCSKCHQERIITGFLNEEEKVLVDEYKN